MYTLSLCNRFSYVAIHSKLLLCIYITREMMMAHIQKLDAKLKLSNQQLNEVVTEFEITLHDLEAVLQK